MTYFGKGIYTLPAAARILNISPQKIHRWVNGYTFCKHNETYAGKPLIKPDFGSNGTSEIISFLDLAELLFINAFIQHGISIKKIRIAADNLSTILESSHPFAMQRMYTDGKSIFAELAEKEQDYSLLDLLKKQYQFEEIIHPSLYECMDFKDYYVQSAP